MCRKHRRHVVESINMTKSTSKPIYTAPRSIPQPNKSFPRVTNPSLVSILPDAFSSDMQIECISLCSISDNSTLEQV